MTDRVPKERIEVRDGQEFIVTRLPSDTRLQPARTRKRALWNKLTANEKAAHIRKRKAAAARKRKRRRRRK